MNIRWNALERRFEAEFTQDFDGDLSAVKNAKFKTDGPPAWVWYTQKITALNKLRKNKPASGLTITPEALEIYTPLAQREEQNAAIKKQLKQARKEQKKTEPTGTPLEGLTEEKFWISAEDLPPRPPFVSQHVITTPVPTLLCIYCNQPVYFYERQEPPTCLWDEKNESKLSFDSMASM